MSTRAPFKFDEFYEAFSKSVASDVIFADGQVHIVRREKEPPGTTTSANQKLAHVDQTLPANNLEEPIKKHAKGRLLDSADRRRLPWSIQALLDSQEPDGSWMFSNSFEFIINGIAPPPVEGISSKLWATAIALTVWRQFPEYFELLETHYEKAMLHADENVLRIVRTVLQFDALDQIRPYKSDEARAIREQLAREAAAKREQELGEEMKLIRLQEEEIRIGKLSLVHARRLPIPTQQLFVAELGSEFSKVFSDFPPQQTESPIHHFRVGQLVESCRRRRTNGSSLAVSTTPCWHICRIASIDHESRLVQLDFLDGACERERRVPMKFVRATAAGTQETRLAQFEALKSSWSQPIVCKAEIARLEEARANKAKPLPWDSRHHLRLQESTREEDEGHRQDDTPHQASSRRPRSSTYRPISQEESKEDVCRPVDSLFQAAAVPLLQYDRAYAGVQAAVESGTRRYAVAGLYRERFHAFDELAEALVELMERTVDALDAIWRWKQTSPDAKTFVWKGDDFIATLVRSLDFLGGHSELAEWYGEEFPLGGNPFMRSTSLLDKAEECGLHPVVQQQQSSALRSSLKLRSCPAALNPPPSWWPEAHYSTELLQRIEQAEQRLLQELLLHAGSKNEEWTKP